MRKTMSFYDGTLDRNKARKLVETTTKQLMYRCGYAYKGAEKEPIDREDAMTVLNDSYLDVIETDTEVILNTYTENDLL